jgi:phosphatidylglycerol:prolipoprotein diacylglycerol transferase
MYIVAFSVAYFFYRKQVKERRFPMTDDDITSLFTWSILGLLLGARIFSTIVYETSSIYRREPWLIFWPFRDGRFTGLQGMSYHGGVIGCIAGFLLWSICKKRDVREIADMLAGAIPIGYTFGRIGNFINGELYGRATASPIGMIFPQAGQLSAKTAWVAEMAEKTGLTPVGPFQLVNLPRHPSQLYEAFFEGVFLWAVIWLVRKKSPFKGFCFGLYAVGYGLIRFIIEYFRQPDADIGYAIEFIPNNLPIAYAHPLTSISTGQLLSFFMALAGICIWIISKRYPNSRFSYFCEETVKEENHQKENRNALRNRRKRRR